MPRRASSLTNISNLAVSREIDSKYDAVKAVAEKLDELELFLATDTDTLIASLNEAIDFTGITVEAGALANWDAVNKVLTVPTVKGDKGDTGAQGETGATGATGATGPRGAQGPKGDKGDMGATGAPGARGAQGEPGPKGDDGVNLTIEQIGYNGNGTFTWQFSDGTSFTTPDMRGAKGDTGDKGDKGDTGVGVHHVAGTATTDPEGDFSTSGELDTYTMYGDADETLVLGWFTVKNGESAYSSAVKGGFEGTEEDFQDGLGELARLVDDVADAVAIANSAANSVINKVDNSDIGVTVQAYDANLVSDAGYVHTDNNYTTIEKNKLAGIEVGATADQTGAEIKSAYEAEANTNAYTDAEKALVSVTTSLNTAAVTLPGAVNEVRADLAAHISDTSTHGVGTVVGTTESQTLTHKLLNDYTNRIHADATHQRVKSTTTITKGQAVVITGYNNVEEALEVTKADQTSGVATGLAESSMVNGEFGSVVVSGTLVDVDTSMWDEGSILYVGSNGVLTTTEPTTGFAQPIAYVLRSNANNGALQVNAYYPKQDASDVRVTPNGNLSNVTVQSVLEALTTVTEW